MYAGQFFAGLESMTRERRLELGLRFFPFLFAFDLTLCFFLFANDARRFTGGGLRGGFSAHDFVVDGIVRPADQRTAAAGDQRVHDGWVIFFDIDEQCGCPRLQPGT